MAVRAILANPRYTGYQVWNRQRRDEVLLDVEDVSLGHETKMRWNNHADWVWSEQPVHEVLIPMETFEAVQAMFGRTRSTTRRTPAEGRHYLVAGMMRCGLCGRRMQGQWNHGRPYFRCKSADARSWPVPLSPTRRTRPARPTSVARSATATGDWPAIERRSNTSRVKSSRLPGGSPKSNGSGGASKPYWGAASPGAR